MQQLYLHPDFQRMGLGGRLIDAVVAIARERGVTGIWLSAWQEADWATSFYRKTGFVESGTAEYRVGTTVYTDWLYWLPLDG